MKVSEVETFVVGNPPPRHGGRYFIFVTLTTDGGVKGVGEASISAPLAALANAIKSATGTRLRQLPMNPQSIVKAVSG